MLHQTTGLFVVLCLAGGSISTVRSALMPGSTPSIPNPNLKDCLTSAGYYNLTDKPTNPNFTDSSAKYMSPFAKALQRWCSVYEAVLPCAENSTQRNPLRSPTDWFFSMIFNSSIANQTSIIMCQKLDAFGKKLTCMKRAQELRAIRCVDALTKPIKKVLMTVYNGNISSMESLAQKASCLISAATATCFREKVNSCRSYLRDFIGAYSLIFGGKCIAMLQTQNNQTENDGSKVKQSPDQQWMSTIQSLLTENNGISTYSNTTTRVRGHGKPHYASPNIKGILLPRPLPQKPTDLTNASDSQESIPIVPLISRKSTRSPSDLFEFSRTFSDVTEQSDTARDSSDLSEKRNEGIDSHSAGDKSRDKLSTNDKVLTSDDKSCGHQARTSKSFSVFLVFIVSLLVLMH